MENILQWLFDNNFKLGGSRRMAQKYPHKICTHYNADWDFYCQNTLENEEKLRNMGFVKIQAENRNYWDFLLADMYKHKEHAIEVLLRTDANLYSRAFESISADEFKHKLWKSSPFIKIGNKAVFKQSVCNRMNELFSTIGKISGNYPDCIPF